MTTDGKDEGTRQEEGDDALWRLLERTPQPGPVSPYFARRVLREVALFEEARPAAGGVANRLARAWRTWRHQPRRVFAGALAAVTLLTMAGGVGLSAMHRHPPVVSRVELPETGADFDFGPQPTVAFFSDPVVTAQDVEVIADLDNLLSREENRLWTEDDTVLF